MSASLLNTFSPRAAFQAALQPGNLASVSARQLSRLMGFLVVLMSLLPAAFTAPSPATLPGASHVSASGASAPSPFLNVNQLGESAKLAVLREGHLLSHLRAIDPFGITIRGPFKGLPPVGEQPDLLNLAAAAAKVPTLEKAVQALPIGGVNARRREILVGSRSIHEGDLLALDFGGRHFVVWLQSVEEHGVVFCDIDLQKHILRPVRSAPKELPVASAPKELPGDPANGMPDIRHFLNKDTQQ